MSSEHTISDTLRIQEDNGDIFGMCDNNSVVKYGDNIRRGAAKFLLLSAESHDAFIMLKESHLIFRHSYNTHCTSLGAWDLSLTSKILLR